MDPQACLFEILDALHDRRTHHPYALDSEEIVERLEALAGWIKKGGFLPTVIRLADGKAYNFNVPQRS